MLVNLDKIQTTLPRNINETMTLPIMIQRKMEYKNAYLSGNIQPNHVMLVLSDLCNTSFYKVKE